MSNIFTLIIFRIYAADERDSDMNITFTGPQRSEYFKKFYPIDHIACDKISRNSAKPPHEVLVIVNRNGKNWLDRFHWGLVPDWAKDTSVGMRLINARVETVAEKPSFRP